jgi:uncharacterized protein with FMN-binding domain
MARKIPGRLVALSAAAVTTVYVAGFLSTQPAADSVAAASAGLNTVAIGASSPGLTGTATDPSSAPAAVVGASDTATPAPSAASVGAYANGTYSGTGTSRFGTVSVSVSVSADRITNVQITKITTSFPASRIASLPAQVVQTQTSNVNVVTGATYSSQAFKQAVQQALAQAVGANSIASAG